MRGNKFETLITVDSRTMFTICQDFYFTVGGMLYKNVGRLWTVSDCEELVGFYLELFLTCEELVGVTWRLSDL